MEITSIHKDNWFTDYTIQWRPLMMCNYDCSYCSPSSHERIVKSNIPTAENLVVASKKLKEQLPNDKTTMVVITGGEPFLIKDIHLWLEYLLNNNFWVMIFTNGSLSDETYENCKTVFSNPRLLFKLSFHPESADINKFSNLANSVKKLGASVEVRAMLVHTMFDKVNELESKLDDVALVRLPVFPLYNKQTKQLNPVLNSSRDLIGYQQTPDNGTLGYYNQEELEILNSIDQDDGFFSITVNNNIPYSADKIQLLGKNVFTGWSCAVVSRKLVILPNGDVHYGICRNEGIIGNIYNNDLILFDRKFTTCKQPLCGVIEEIMITKNKLS